MEHEVNRLLEFWEGQPLKKAKEIIQKYGYPQEAMPSRLVWHNNGPWKRTVIYSEPLQNDFSTSLGDFLEQTIDYTIPMNLCSEVADFDSGVYPNWTNGEVSTISDKEAISFLALNLLDDIVTRRRDIHDAKMFYAKHAYLYNTQNISSPYTTYLLFL